MTKLHDELLACPFCGPGQSMVDPWFDEVCKRWKIGCGRCGCSTGTTPRREDDSVAVAAARWNTRPAHPQAGEVVARPAGWTYGFKDGFGTRVYTVLNSEPPSPSKSAPTQHHGGPITDVRPFFYAHPQPHAEDDAELREKVELALWAYQTRAATLNNAADSILKLISAARRDDQGARPDGEGSGDFGSSPVGDTQPGAEGAVVGDGGWIVWAGGENPVPATMIDVQTRDGRRWIGETSDAWSWSHSEDLIDADDQITAYRPASPGEVA